MDSNRAETFLPANWWIGLMATPTINAMTDEIENTLTKCHGFFSVFFLLLSSASFIYIVYAQTFFSLYRVQPQTIITHHAHIVR